MTFTNMYNLNMNNMTGVNLLQSGLSFIGGGTAMSGYGNFQIGNLLGGNVFTNCYGEVDYDKVAGYQVANALFSVGAQAYQSIKAQKEPQVDNSKEIADLNKQIKTKQESLLDKTTEVTNLGTDKLNAENEIKSLQGQKIQTQSLESDVVSARKAYDTDPTPENKTALDNAEKALSEAKAKNEEIERQIESQKKIIEDANAKISTLNDEIDTLNDDLDDLKSKRDNLQTKSNQQILSQKAGNFITRASKDCVNDTYSAETNPASRSEMQRAYTEFVKCSDPAQKKVYAEKVKEMYESNPDLKGHYKDRIEAIDWWLEKNAN